MFKNETVNRIVNIVGMILFYVTFSIFYFPSSSDDLITKVFFFLVSLVFIGIVIHKIYKFKQ
ncbi:hypothetical protein SAMN04487936_101531 [Halobacillus dabanensis]|uniref:YrhC-like protein n=1 Tax=Halobacillus dabanensis TaxID=240302 RepID=A0A1I3Q3T2_HALDA|nr:hypothetical protein SAMN04487936_101531 [Halobacillus dabanensis]